MKGLGLPGALPRVLTQRRSRCLFHRRAADGSLLPVTGQTPTFARASVGSAAMDRQGRVSAPVHSQPVWTMVDTDGDGVRDELGLLLDPGAGNLVKSSESYATDWTAIGTPTGADGSIVLGQLSLPGLGDDSAAALEGRSQVIAFSGDAVKAISTHWRSGVSSVLRLRQTTGTQADKLLTVIDASGNPTTPTGVFIGRELIGIDPLYRSSVYRLHFATASVLAGETNQLEIYPATTSGLAVGNTGDAVIGCTQAENLQAPTGYVRTGTGAGVSRSADALTYATAFSTPPDLTLYVRFARPVWAALSGSIGHFAGLLALGTGNGRLECYLNDNTREVKAQLTDRSGAQVQIAQAIPAGAVIEACLQVTNALNSVSFRMDVGAGFGAYSSPLGGLTEAYTTLAIGDLLNAPGNCAATPIFSAKVASGLRTLAEMRQLL